MCALFELRGSSKVAFCNSNKHKSLPCVLSCDCVVFLSQRSSCEVTIPVLSVLTDKDEPQYCIHMAPLPYLCSQ